MTAHVNWRGALRDLRVSAALHFGFGLALLVALAGLAGPTIGLPLSYLLQAALGFLAIAALAFLALPRHLPQRRFGAANDVTLLRAVICALCIGLLGPAETAAAASWWLPSLAGFALALDGLDGWAARRWRSASEFGARFDMELDALFILVLALLVYGLGKAGIWVLASGLLRYLFVAAAWVWPRLAASLPPRRGRQTACVLQTLALVFCLIPLAVPPVSTALAAGGLTLLSLSFLIDLVWLIRRPPTEGEDP